MAKEHVRRKPSDRTVAIHEAGHVVGACRLLRGVKEAGLGHHNFSKVEAAGYVLFKGPFRHHEKNKTIAAKDRARVTEHGFRQIVVCLAGPLAHARHTRRSFKDVLDVWGSNDLGQARTLGSHITTGIVYMQLVSRRGLLFPGKFLQMSDEAREVVAAAEEYARQLVADDWLLIEAVANKLMAGALKHDDPVLRRITRIDGRLTHAEQQ